VTGRRARRALAGALCALAALAAACVRPPRLERPASASEARALLDTLAARERSMQELRVSMSVRLTGATPASMLSSPAYLAIDGPDAIRLQVLSPFGITVLDLAITGEDYQLTLPLRHEVRKGRIDPDTIAAPGTTADDRTIVALALLFRPKIDAATCNVESSSTVWCPIGAGLSATITVDDERRPERERYARADGTVLLSVAYRGYGDGGTGTIPERIEIRDTTSETTLIVHVLRFRTGDASGTYP
jgi:hypothetical protein